MHGQQERSAWIRRGQSPAAAEELSLTFAGKQGGLSDAKPTPKACDQVIDITTPPSARTGEPFSALASRDATNATTSAISSGLVMRLRMELGRALSMNLR